MVRSRVIDWIVRFRKQGVPGLKNKPRGGAKAVNPQVTPSPEAELIEGLKEGLWPSSAQRQVTVTSPLPTEGEESRFIY
jgi:hypothetical protein